MSSRFPRPATPPKATRPRGPGDSGDAEATARSAGSDAEGRVTASSAVRRAADVLVALTDQTDLGVSELSRRFGWPKSVAHRVLNTLAQAGLVASDPVTHRYRLGPAALRLGLAALARADVHALAVPHLLALRNRTGETATLTILSGETRLYVDQVQSCHTVRQSIQIGSHAPLYVGANSKAILAFLPADRRERILASAMDGIRADGSPVDVAALRADLETIQAVGYAVSQSERITGATSVAAPIHDGKGDVIGSMSVAGVTVRQDRAALDALGPTVRGEALALSLELGWKPPPREPPPLGVRVGDDRQGESRGG